MFFFKKKTTTKVASEGKKYCVGKYKWVFFVFPYFDSKSDCGSFKVRKKWNVFLAFFFSAWQISETPESPISHTQSATTRHFAEKEDF